MSPTGRRRSRRSRSRYPPLSFRRVRDRDDRTFPTKHELKLGGAGFRESLVYEKEIGRRNSYDRSAGGSDVNGSEGKFWSAGLRVRNRLTRPSEQRKYPTAASTLYCEIGPKLALRSPNIACCSRIETRWCHTVGTGDSWLRVVFGGLDLFTGRIMVRAGEASAKAISPQKVRCPIKLPF